MLTDGTVGQPYIVERDGVLLWSLDGREFPVMAGGDGEGAPAPAPAPTDAPGDEAKPADSGTKSQPSPAKDRGASPWAKDLSERGLDDPRFDEYLRTSWQPRMTQHEQAIAKYNQLFGGDENADIASRIFQGLTHEDGAHAPDTIKELVRLLELDPKSLFEMQQAAEEAQPEGTTPEAETQPDPRQQWIDQQMERETHAKQDADWSKHLEERTGAQPGFHTNLYTHLVRAEQGDTEAAWAAYQELHNEFGLTPADPDPEVPTLGETSITTPRESKGRQSIAQAVSEHMAEERASRGK